MMTTSNNVNFPTIHIHIFPYNSYPSPLGTTRFLIMCVSAVYH